MSDRILTSNVCPPIPVRSFDWCACFDGDEESPERYGWGATKAAALADLANTITEPLLEQRDSIERALDEQRAQERPTWHQEARIDALLEDLEAIAAKITALDEALGA